MKLTKGKITGIIAVAVLLIAVFWWGGNAPGMQGWATSEPETAKTQTPPDQKPETEQVIAADAPEVQTEKPQTSAKLPEEKPAPPKTVETRPGGKAGGLTADEKLKLADQLACGSAAATVKGDPNYSADKGMTIDKKTGKDQYLTAPVPQGKPVPVEPENAVVSDTEYTCTLSVSCAAILDNMDWLNAEKAELIPEDGVILQPTTVTFYQGESVFNVLTREMKKNKIHMEFVNTPIYNSAYIEAISNIYEFDCGELSGWMYKVNDWFPNYGCSRYELKQGDVVEWMYTCDLGTDVGAIAAAEN